MTSIINRDTITNNPDLLLNNYNLLLCKELFKLAYVFYYMREFALLYIVYWEIKFI